MNCYMLIIWALSTLVDASTDSGETINITTTTINDTTQAATVLLPDSLLASFSPMLDIYLPPAVRDFLVSCHRALTSWLGFDPTILLSLGPIVWAAKRLWSEVKVLVVDDIICNWFTARVEVGDDDPIFIHIMRWVAVQPNSAKTRFLQADTIAGSADDHDEDDEAGAVAAAGAAAVKNATSTTSTTSTTTTTDPSNTNTTTTTKKKKQNPTLLPNGEVCLNFSTHKHQKPPRFLPAVNVPYTFSFGGTYFWLNRTRSHIASQSEYRGLSMRKEENLVITCVGFSARPIKNFIQFTKEWNHSRQAATTVVRRPARPEMRSWGGRHVWAEVADRPIRPMDTVVLDEKQKLMMLQDMNEYLQRETAQWYGERGIPLRRGYLFHGPPGTGKTSLSFALAGVFGLDIFVISLLDQNLTEDDLAMLFTNLPRRCVVLLEDIDTAGLVNRGKEEESESSSESSDSDSEEGGSGASGSEDNDYLRSEKKRALQVLLLGDDLEKKKNRKGKKKGKVSAKQETLEKEVAERVAEFKQMLKDGSDEEKDGEKVTDEKVIVDKEATEDREKTPAKSEEKPVSSADDAGEKDEKTTKSESEPATDKRKKKKKKPMTAKEKRAKKKQKIRKKNKAMATSVLHNLHNIEYIGRQYDRRRPSPYDRERGISLSGLLNAIDGVASHEGRVLIMTTNKPEKLDEALLRPGRVDLQIAFLNATQEQVRELFERMYEADVVDPATTAVTLTKVGNKLTASTTTTAAATTLPLVFHSPPAGITSPGNDTAAEKGDEEKQHQQQLTIVDPKIVDLKLLDDNNNNPRKSSVSSCSSDATAIGSEEDNAASPASPNTSSDPNTNTIKTTDTTAAAAAEKPQPQQPPSDKKKEEPPVPLHITPLTRSELQKIAKEFSLKIPPTQILSPAEIQGFLLRRKKDPRRALAEVDKWVEELVKAKESKSKILDAKAI